MSAKLSHQSRSEQQQKEPKEPVPGISITEAARLHSPMSIGDCVAAQVASGCQVRCGIERIPRVLEQTISKMDTVEFSLIGFFVALYETKQVIELSKLEILQPQLAWTRNIMTSVSHMADDLLLKCRQQRDKEATRTIMQLKAEVDPIKHRANCEKNVFTDRKNEMDAALLEKLPPASTKLAGVKESMIDLHTLWLANRKLDTMDARVKCAINVIIAGITRMNSCAGRPGEWVNLQRKDVVEFLKTEGNCLRIREHKTVKSMGVLGRYIPEGNLTAIRKVLDLHDEDAKYFTSPPKGNNKPMHASNLLKKWGFVYTLGFQVPKPTLMRKWCRICEQEGAGAAEASFASLCDMNGHAEKTGKIHYVASKPERRAMVAAHIREA